LTISATSHVDLAAELFQADRMTAVAIEDTTGILTRQSLLQHQWQSDSRQCDVMIPDFPPASPNRIIGRTAALHKTFPLKMQGSQALALPGSIHLISGMDIRVSRMSAAPVRSP
jgi:hypothetical protein